jgi:hypothetical protein
MMIMPLVEVAALLLLDDNNDALLPQLVVGT